MKHQLSFTINAPVTTSIVGLVRRQSRTDEVLERFNQDWDYYKPCALPRFGGSCFA